MTPLTVNLFTLGDCADLNTWSNLPYYFYQNLRAQSVAVRPVNLVPSTSVWYHAFDRLRASRHRVSRFLGAPGPDLLRSRAFRVLVNRRLRAFAQQHPHADANVFLTFSFSSYRYMRVPVIHYCDRTYEQHLEETGRKPTRSDRFFMRIDQRNIENASLVLSTNQPCREFISSRYRPKQSLCLRPGINTETAVDDPEGLIEQKEKSTDILFIGRGVHKRGADILIRAFTLFNGRHGRRFTLHVVGVERSELPADLRPPSENIRFYGYLDRTRPMDLERYNALLRSARMFVMPMRAGPFPGVVSELQLHCTPIIASNVTGMSEVLTDGRDSLLVDGFEPNSFAHAMDRLVADGAAWRQMAWNSHVRRRNWTWADTVKTFLEMIHDNHMVG
jgi:glycosyltransferase involved in cell wall biosynthesis